MKISAERILAIAPSWLGDAVMATPAFRALRAAYASSRITLLCRPGIERALDGLALFDGAIVDRMGGLLGPMRRGLRLRRERFDLALLFPNSFRSALAVRIAGIPRRVGYRRDGRGALLTDAPSAPSERPRSTIDFYCDLLERGLDLAVSDRRPQLSLSEVDAQAAARLLEDVPRPFALFVPGGNKPAKRWPPERFARTAEHLARRHGCATALAGSPSERPILEAVRGAAAVPVFDLARRGLDLGSLKGVVAASRLVLTNDTGPRHVAVALGVPTVVFFGPTDHRWTLIPSARERLLVAEPFLPEELVADDRPKVCTVERITLGDCVAAVDAILDGREEKGER